MQSIIFRVLPGASKSSLCHFKRALSSTDAATHYGNIIVSQVGDKTGSVGLIQMNKPETRNSLSSSLFLELVSEVNAMNNNQSIKCIVITGSERCFSVGVDVDELSNLSNSEMARSDGLLLGFDRLTEMPKPMIAAVNGFALGGGCELAMICDIVYAGNKARFGQPEIRLGIIPGAGATQRLIRSVGKSRAMELILSGEMLSAQEAVTAGLVSRIFPPNLVVEKAIDLADRIAGNSTFALHAAKSSVNAAYNLPLSEGIDFERRLFHSALKKNDARERMKAYLEGLNTRQTDF